MKIIAALSIIMIFLIVGCSQQQFTQDDAKQIAVNAVLNNDRYTQNEVDNFRVLSESKGDCETCYTFEMSFAAKVEEKANIIGYSAIVKVTNNEVADIQFTELANEETIYPIEDTTDQLCVNKCGDGVCQEIVCQASGCPCAETKDSCAVDC